MRLAGHSDSAIVAKNTQIMTYSLMNAVKKLGHTSLFARILMATDGMVATLKLKEPNIAMNSYMGMSKPKKRQ